MASSLDQEEDGKKLLPYLQRFERLLADQLESNSKANNAAENNPDEKAPKSQSDYKKLQVTVLVTIAPPRLHVLTMFMALCSLPGFGEEDARDEV